MVKLKRRPENSPAVFHVTHYKAGSQWIYAILRNSVPRDRLVAPRFDASQFLREPVQPGCVYPTLYLTRREFEGVRLPPVWRRLVVIRDLRDTLVSAYFSIKISHPGFQVDAVQRLRDRLQAMDLEEGLLHMIDIWLPDNVRIQESWLDEGESLVRYEDLVEANARDLERLLLETCELGVPRWRLRRAIRSARFERQSGGRSRGEEDIGAHQRKGVAGDWRNYFTPAIKSAFKRSRAGEVLIAAGYERDASW